MTILDSDSMETSIGIFDTIARISKVMIVIVTMASVEELARKSSRNRSLSFINDGAPYEDKDFERKVLF